MLVVAAPFDAMMNTRLMLEPSQRQQIIELQRNVDRAPRLEEHGTLNAQPRVLDPPTAEQAIGTAFDLRLLLAAPKVGEDFAGTASGCRKGLAWRMFLLAPLEFSKARLSNTTPAKEAESPAGEDRLFLYYAPPAK